VTGFVPRFASKFLRVPRFAQLTLTQAVITGMVSGAVQSGTLKGALIGGFSAGMFHGIGDVFEGVKGTTGALAKGGELTKLGTTAKIGAHAVAGGVMSVLQGGKFGHGFISAGVVEAKGSKALSMAGDNKVAQIIGAAVIGGTASRLAGGMFSNGAVTGAFSWAFNELGQHGDSDARSGLASDGDGNGLADAFEFKLPPSDKIFSGGFEGCAGNCVAPFV